MIFEPVAIVGQACLLPGAQSADDLWQIVSGKRVMTSPAPATRWRADRERMLSSGACVTDRGGFVEGFERIWTPAQYPIDQELLADLDPLFQWLLHVGRAALLDAGTQPSERTGAIVGNLAYPTDALIDLAQAVHVPDARARKRHRMNRFSAGYPVQLMCSALGLSAGGFAIDAACASSLYAIHLACEWLHSGRAGCMLAGGINRCDSLLIHSGFTALRALSPTGQSRPFHRDADGLIPAEGIALVVLKRLQDAEASGDTILGVIRGIGLSNDGRASGILTPAEKGQVQAMRAAYAQAGLSPRDISYVECHATGTPVGDAVEIRSMAEVFACTRDIPIGSLKANLGHLITASGAAGVMKVLAAMRHGILPPSVNAAPLTSALDGTPFRVPENEAPWVVSEGPRRAAISSFGFGGNNGHLILEEYLPKMRFAAQPAIAADRIAVVAMAAQVADGGGTQDFVTDLLYGGRVIGDAATQVALQSTGLVFPPRDLGRALAQQSLLLTLGREAITGLKKAPGERTSVLTGIECDAEGTRPTLRLALPDLLPTGDPALSGRETALDEPLDAARVIGCMPNIAANRLNRQYELSGPSFSVFAEESSGIRALEIAIAWLRKGDIDTAIVGAADLAVEPVHRAAVDERPGDAAVVLVLMREKDAFSAGERVLAVLETEAAGQVERVISERISQAFGKAHAASELLNVAGAIAAVANAALPVRRPILSGKKLAPVDGITVAAHSSPRTAASFPDTPDIHLFRGRNLEMLVEALGRDSTGEGDFRLAIVAAAADRAAKIQQALEFLSAGAIGQPPEGIFFRREPVLGELAFVYTGAAAAYAGMGRDLLLALPDLADRVRARCIDADQYANWIYEHRLDPPSDFEQLCGSSFLCQVHSEFTRGVLRLSPSMAIGLSSGETNALYALGAWEGMGEFLAQIRDCGLYTEILAGRADAVHQAWRERGITGERWAHYRVSSTREELDTAMRGEPAVHLAIINSAEDFVIGGEESACARVVNRIVKGWAAPLAMELAVHCPDLQPAAALWHRLHRQPTVQPGGIRFYSNASGGAYLLTPDSVADALTNQALATVDFPRTIRQAWNDGARIFLEHGPRNQCTQSIRAVLGDLAHLAISLDVAGRSAILQACCAAAELWTAGVDINFEALRGQARKNASAGDLIFPAHPSSSRAPARQENVVHRMEPAPALAPLLDLPDETSPPVVPPVVPPTLALPGFGALATATAVHAQLSASHQAYVAEMARLQQAFLETEQRLLHALNGSSHAPLPLEAAPAVETRSFSRLDLERLASGHISEIFGPAFAQQDSYLRQVRMPEPPMLLADRVVALHGEANSMGLGNIVTETDVGRNSWYLHQGYMPAGIAVEAGQADLLLISWLGADVRNQGDRVYRLLGCDLTFHGTLPKAGETLRYDIHVDGYANSGEIRMFFFHYDCVSEGKPRLSVRDGQAGFFTDEELANSEGVLWSPATGEHTLAESARLSAATRPTTSRSFDEDHLRAFSEGRIPDCFGPGFERAFVHTRSPRIPDGRMQMIQRVTDFDPTGGPWKRGYLRAEWTFAAGDWFFEGHFRNDPCMPGTLMFEGCFQAMAFYLSALGLTLERDGWRFEPVPEQSYPLRCRGQATPKSKLLVYELFVDEVVDGAEPALFADVLCTIDGLKAFHCRRLGLRLVPDWPLEEEHEELMALHEPKPVAVLDGFAYGYHSLLACALGRPTDAFGPAFARFDGPIRTPRLPTPPYHFISRVVNAAYGVGGAVGGVCEVEYDVPRDAWYFVENGSGAMPACVFLEAILQPCGWLASFAGTWLKIQNDIFFRNLDGSGKILGEVTRSSGTVSTKLKLTSFSELAGMTIYAFAISCHTAGHPLFEGTAVFGNFPAAALEQQAGIPVTEAEAEWLPLRSEEEIDLESLPQMPRLGSGRVRMLDRITGYWPQGGAAGLGRIRGEKDLDSKQWFFKAHFFNDPVQPGSLGIEAMIQALQVLMLRRQLQAGISNPRFEPLAIGEPVGWMYRGQVTPNNRRISVLVELLETSPGFAKASGSLWVDGKKIYAMPSFAMRIVAGDPEEEVLDPAHDRWLLDHCPTYSVPALPMMSVIDRLATAAQRTSPELFVTEIQDASLSGWISFAAGTRRLKAQATPETAGRVDATLSLWRHSDKPGMSRFDPVAHGRVILSSVYPKAPEPLAPLLDAVAVPDPYESGELFHGPAFQLMKSLRRSHAGASFLLDAGITQAPRGMLHQVLLDGATHGIPNDHLQLWCAQIPEDVVGYPVHLSRLSLFGPTPISGLVRCEVRFAGFDHHETAQDTAPMFDIQWIANETVWASARLIYTLLPKGPMGQPPAAERRAYLRDHVWKPSREIGRYRDGATLLTARDIAQNDWLAGTVQRVFQAATPIRLDEIAVKQHVARSVAVHPAEISVAENGRLATCARYPLTEFPVHLTHDGEQVSVRDESAPRLETGRLRGFWTELTGIADWPIADLNFALIERFVRRVELIDPAGFAALRGQPVLYLANHQVAVESLLFNVITSALSGVPLKIIAKKEHRETWIGQLIELTHRYPGVRHAELILFFDREDPASLLNLLRQFRSGSDAEQTSLMVHVEGTRARSCREPITRMSSVFTDLAAELQLPIVPVRLAGGLPETPVPERLDFPFDGGQQDIIFGEALAPDEIRRLQLRERSRTIREAIERLRPEHEQPLPRSTEWPPLADGTKPILLETLRSAKRTGDVSRMMFQGSKTAGPLSQWLSEFREWLQK